MIIVSQYNENYVTTFTISQIANHVCLAHINHLFDKRINIYMKKRNEFGETFVHLAQIK